MREKTNTLMGSAEDMVDAWRFVLVEGKTGSAKSVLILHPITEPMSVQPWLGLLVRMKLMISMRSSAGNKTGRTVGACTHYNIVAKVGRPLCFKLVNMYHDTVSFYL